MGPIADLAMQTAGKLVDTGLGLVLEGHNDRRQLRQQGKLGQQQVGLNQQNMANQKAADLQFANDTSYNWQMGQMEKAGLSPGLMYGMSGGGGVATGNSGGGVNAPDAPRGGNEVLGMQMANAQRALIEAQTENVKTNTAKTAGVDTNLTKEQGRMATIAANLAAMTQEEAAEQMQARTHILWEEAKAAKGIITADLQRKQAEAIGATLMNELKQAQKDLTVEQIGAIGETIAQKWKELDIKEGELALKKFVHDISDSTKLTVETITKAVQMVGGAVTKGIPTEHNTTTTKKIEW